MIRLRKNKIDRAWENVCMAMMGEQFLVGSEICGVVLSTRFPVSFPKFFFFEEFSYRQYMICIFFKHLKIQEDLLSVWNRSAADQNCTNKSNQFLLIYTCFKWRLILFFLLYS